MADARYVKIDNQTQQRPRFDDWDIIASGGNLVPVYLRTVHRGNWRRVICWQLGHMHEWLDEWSARCPRCSREWVRVP